MGFNVKSYVSTKNNKNVKFTFFFPEGIYVCQKKWRIYIETPI